MGFFIGLSNILRMSYPVAVFSVGVLAWTQGGGLSEKRISFHAPVFSDSKSLQLLNREKLCPTVDVGEIQGLELCPEGEEPLWVSLETHLSDLDSEMSLN
ncbi:MAG: hypothetical protein ACO3A2_07140 [Bdellovibrionia bacterium]